jgi:hypothetical protein
VAEPEVECAVCGRVGRVTAHYRQIGGAKAGAIFDRMDGLEPAGCEGCRKALHEAGFTVAVFGPGGTIRPEQT